MHYSSTKSAQTSKNSTSKRGGVKQPAKKPPIQPKTEKRSHSSEDLDFEHVNTKPITGLVRTIQRKGGSGEVSASLESRLSNSKGGGNSLPQETNEFMSSRFGTGFSGVKVHTDSSAVQMNKELNSQAFAHGNHIYFNQGKYDTSSSSGQHLLAHELTHTVQQFKGSANKVNKKPAEKDHYYFRPVTQFSRLNRLLNMIGIRLVLIDKKAMVKPPKKKHADEHWEAKLEYTSITPSKVKSALGTGPHFISKKDDIKAIIKFVEAFRKSYPKTFLDIQAKDLKDAPPITDDEGKPSCIPTFNNAIVELYGDNPIKGKKVLERGDLSGTAFGSIKKLQKLGLAEKSVKVGANKSGFNKSVDDLIIKTVKKEKHDGYYAFLMSLYNGFHSVILIANRITSGGTVNIELIWKDQHGLKVFGKAGIDAKAKRYITLLIAHTENEHQEKTAQKVYKKSYRDLDGRQKKEVDARIKKTWVQDLKKTLISQLKQKEVK
ncbi:eCIS core domain-containing protein [Ekhidna sp.]